MARYEWRFEDGSLDFYLGGAPMRKFETPAVEGVIIVRMDV